MRYAIPYTIRHSERNDDMKVMKIELIVNADEVKLITDEPMLPTDGVVEMLNTIHKGAIKGTFKAIIDVLEEMQKDILKEGEDDKSDSNVPEYLRGIFRH